MIPDVPAPPDDLVRWCGIYADHVAPWLVRGLFLAHLALYLILFLQRRNSESKAARALRWFVLSKAGLWCLIAIDPGGSWATVAYAGVITWITGTTGWLLAMLVWNYVVPSLWPEHGGSPAHVEAMAAPKPWDGINRRVGPKDRRRSSEAVPS